MTTRVVVIGGSGFVGQHLKAILVQRGNAVLSLSSSDCNLLNPEVDAILERSLKDDDVIVFASALTPDKGKDEHAFMKNVQMSYSAAAYFARKKHPHLIYISSDAVYGDEFNPITEAIPASAPSLYGMAHRAREMILEAACARVGTPFLILRPCALYGKGDTHNSYGPNRFIKTARVEGKISLFGQGLEKRDHLYVTDFGEIIACAIRQGLTGILNACTGQSLSFMEVAESVQALRSGIRIEASPQNGPVVHRHFDATRLRREMPLIAFTSLSDGLKQIL